MAIKPSVYVLGTQPLVLKPDAGAGPWNSQDKELGMIVLKALLTGRVDDVPTWVKVSVFAPLLLLKLTGLTLQFGASHFGGDDAVRHLLHYLGNSGATLSIDLLGMVNEVAIAKETYQLQIDTAKKFIETLPPGRHAFTSTSGSLNHYITQSRSRNWFFAVGSYSSWGRGFATVQVGVGKMNYSMDYEYQFFDRYNWDGGKQVQIPLPGYDKFPELVQDLVNKLPNVQNGRLTVTDEFMAKFHRQGLAKEFDMVGTLKITVNWTSSVSFVNYKVRPGDTLSSIAKLFFGNSSKSTVLQNANRTVISNPHLLRVGQEIKIPLT